MRYLLFLLFIFSFSVSSAQVFNDETPLVETLVFGELWIALPTPVLEDRVDEEKQAFIEMFEELGKRKFRDETGTLLISIDKKEAGVSPQTIKNLTENFARNFYRGTIYRKEEAEIHGLSLYILDIIGYWNGSKTPSSMLFILVFTAEFFYDITLRYPEADFDYSEAVKEEMIYSIRLEKKN